MALRAVRPSRRAGVAVDHSLAQRNLAVQVAAEYQSECRPGGPYGALKEGASISGGG